MKNLNYVGSLVQLDLQDFTTHQLTRIMQYAIHCYKTELRYKVDRSVEVAYLTLNDVNNVSFPKDYEYYTKVAINVGGLMITLSRNDAIPFQRRNDCGNPMLEPANLDLLQNEPYVYPYGFYYAPHYRNGQFVGEMYSMGGGFNEVGYFREDMALRQFQFYNVPRSEIILEYVADKNANGSTLVYMSDVEVIRQYVHWQLLEHDRRASRGEADRKMGLFNAALTKRVEIEYTPTISDFMDAMWSGIKSSPKR